MDTNTSLAATTVGALSSARLYRHRRHSSRRSGCFAYYVPSR